MKLKIMETLYWQSILLFPANASLSQSASAWLRYSRYRNLPQVGVSTYDLG
jgi:hypothetical protein